MNLGNENTNNDNSFFFTQLGVKAFHLGCILLAVWLVVRM